MNITVALRFDDLPLKRFVGKVYDRITRMFRLLAFALPVLGLALAGIRLASGQQPSVLGLSFGVFFLVFYLIHRAAYQRAIVAHARRQWGGAAETTFTLADDAYEVRCGGTWIRTRWQDLGDGYLFLGDGFAVTEGRNPILFVPSLSALGVEASEMKEVLTRAGLKDCRTFRGRDVIILVLALLVGALLGSLGSLSQSARPCTASGTDACVYDEDEDEDEEDAGLGADEDAKPFSLGDINFEESSLSLDYKVSAARSPTKNNVISYQDLANIIAVLRQQKDPKNIALFLEITDAADASRPLETLATLTNANFSITLWLTSCSNLVDVAVLGGMPLKELSLGLTGDSLRAVRGLERCPLETLSISGGGLSSLSDICPLPHVKKLELCYTGLAEPSREEVKARFPELDLLYFRGEDGAKTVPFFSETERFSEAVKDADRVIVRKVSWDMGPKDFERAPALVTLTDPQEIAAFRALFRFRDKGEFFDCFCAGNPLIDWYRGDVRLARTPVHHLQGLKWDRFYGAAFFTAEAQAALRAWFAEHQIECK